MKIDLRFEKPFKSHSTSTFTFTPEGERTVVTWRMTGAASGAHAAHPSSSTWTT